jgi:hypothetical protein
MSGIWMDSLRRFPLPVGTLLRAICSTGGQSDEALLKLHIDERAVMDEEALNTSVRRFLKTFGVSAQREIEKAVRDADSKGQLTEPRLPAKAVLTVGGIDLRFEIESDIALA